MNVYDAVEQAFKNGYEAGMRDFARKLREHSSLVGSILVSNKIIDDILKGLK